MSAHRFPGGVISATPPSPTAAIASGVWTLEEAMRNKQAGVWPEGSGLDLNYPSNVLMLHGDGTNGAQNNTFLDGSSNAATITRNGNPTQGSFSPYYGPGSWSYYFPGSSCGLASSVKSPGTADFTLECWFYATGPVNAYKPILKGYGGSASQVMEIRISAAGTSVMNYMVNGNAYVGTTTIQLYQWYHVVMTRQNGTVRAYLNGVQDITATPDASNIGALNVYIGTDQSQANFFTGYISNARYIRGTSMYTTTTFTPPTMPLTATQDTGMLTCNLGTFRDQSGSGANLTVYGSTTAASRFSPFSLYQDVTPASYSAYFDGTGDYIQTTDIMPLELGAADFTIEFWFFSNSYNTASALVGKRATGTTNGPFTIFKNSSNAVLLYAATGATTWDMINGATIGSIAMDKWNHISVCRAGSSFYGSVNGTVVFLGTNSGTIGDVATPWTIGSDLDSQGLNGSISNLRMVKGTARYTKSFTVPTAPFSVTDTGIGTFDHSMSFDGGNDALNLTAPPALAHGMDDFTIEMWFNPSLVSASGQNLYEGRASAGAGAYPALYFLSGTLRWYVNSADRITSSSSLVVGTWYHVAVTRASGVTRMFLNGVQTGSSYLDGTSYLIAASRPMIGSYDGTSGNVNGSISNLRVISGAALYTNTFTPSTTSLTAAPQASVGTQSASVTFDGTGDYLTIASGALTAMDFTVEGWVNRGSTASHTLVCLDSNNTTGYAGLSIDVSSADAKMYVLMSTSGTAWAVNFASTNTVPQGVWTHFALVRAGSIVTLYLNGVANGSANIGTSALYSGGYNFIGARYVSSALSQFLTGALSNVRIAKGVAVYSGNFTPATSALTATTSVPSNQSWSTSFDGTGDYLTTTAAAAFAWGTGDFTVELWFNTNAAFSSARTNIAGTMGTGGGLFAPTNTSMNWNSFGVGDIMTAAFVPTPGQWYHLAYSRSGTTGRLFVNGALLVSGTDSTNYTYTTFSVGFSSAQYLNAYISNLRVVKGQALYTSAFTPSTTPLTVTSQGATASNVSLLTCQDNILVDNSTSYHFAVTPSGDAKPSSLNPFVSTNGIGGTSYCAALDGTGDYLTPSGTLPAIGTGDFTAEFWMYVNAAGTYNVLDWRPASTNGLYLTFYLNSMVPTLYVNSAARITGTAVTPGQWMHVALCRASGNTKMFINGVQQGSTYADTNSYLSPANRPTIGTAGYDLAAPLNGYISNVRIVNGTALYSYGFAPPTSTLTAVAGTQLLTCHAPTLIDGSVNAFAITAAGDARADALNPFSGATTLLTAQDRIMRDNSAVLKPPTSFGDAKPGSPNPFGGTPAIHSSYGGYFDGSGDYLSLPTKTGGYLTSGSDFTVEGWVCLNNYPQVSSTSYASAMVATSGSSNGWEFLITGTTGSNITGVSFTMKGVATATYTGALVLGQWYHLAAVRSNGILKVYVNGVAGATTATLSAWTDNATLWVGACTAPSYPFYLNGYISNVRITNGQALYTGNFTPSVTPLTKTSQGATASNVLLLTCQNDQFLDNSNTGAMITAIGDARPSGINPFSAGVALLTCQDVLYFDNSPSHFPIVVTNDVRPSTSAPFAAVNPVLAAGSVSFDGTGDYIANNSTDALTFGTGDFSVEYWFYVPLAFSGAQDTVFLEGQALTGSFQIYYSGVNSKFYVGTYGGALNLDCGNSYKLARWNHFAVCRKGTMLAVYINGVRVAYSGANSTNFLNGQLNIGSRGGTLPLMGYLSDLRVVKGNTAYSPYSVAITPPTAPLTAITGTSLLTCRGATIADNSGNNVALTAFGDAKPDGFSPYGGGTILLTCQNPTLVDNSGNARTLTSTGNAALRKASPFADTPALSPTPYTPETYGGSIYFDGTGDYLDCGSGAGVTAFSGTDFTWECWTYLTAWPQSFGTYYNISLFGTMPNGGTTGFEVTLSGTASSITSVLANFKSAAGGVTGTVNLYLNHWYHIAVTKSGSTVRIFVNGALVGTGTFSTWTDATPLTVGGLPSSTYRNSLTGYIANLRMIKGTALYTAAFAPPTAPLTAISGTQLLLNGTNAGIVDTTGYSDIETVGSAQISTSAAKYGTGSIAYPSTGSYIVMKGGRGTFNGALLAGQDLFYANATFTIETWINPTAKVTGAGYLSLILGDANTSSGTALYWGVGLDSTGKPCIMWYDGAVKTATGGTVISNSTWTHIAFVVTAGVVKIFVNGVAETLTGTTTLTTPSSSLGTLSSGVDRAQYWTGYLDDLRMTKGVARYSTNFTPPAAPFNNY